MKEGGMWKGATKGNGNVQTNSILFLGTLKTSSALNVP